MRYNPGVACSGVFLSGPKFFCVLPPSFPSIPTSYSPKHPRYQRPIHQQSPKAFPPFEFELTSTQHKIHGSFETFVVFRSGHIPWNGGLSTGLFQRCSKSTIYIFSFPRVCTDLIVVYRSIRLTDSWVVSGTSTRARKPRFLGWSPMFNPSLRLMGLLLISI